MYVHTNIWICVCVCVYFTQSLVEMQIAFGLRFVIQ